MRLLIVAPYPPGRAPSQRYRFEQYLPHLEADGVEVRLRPLWTDDEYGRLHRAGGWAAKGTALARALGRRREDVREASWADVVLVHREAFPVFGPWAERRLARGGPPLVFDFDDAIFLPNVSRANRLAGFLKRPGKVAAIARLSAVTLVGNRYLAGFAERWARDVRIVPSAIDTDEYFVPPPRDGDAVRIGWTGSVTTLPHLLTIEAVLARVQERTGAAVRLIGVPDYRPRSFEAEVLPWSAATEVADLAPVDVGVMPLPDSPWTRGKCGMKLLQYMGLGRAAVASPVGANLDIVRDGENGLLASHDDAWEAALVRLVEDGELRRRLGANARRTVVERYSVRATYPDFLRALRDAAGAR